MAQTATTTTPDPLRELLKVQERRAQAYTRLHAGFRKLIGAAGEGEGAASAALKRAAGAGAAGEPAYSALLTELTSEFAALSSRAREIEAGLTESGKQDEAALVRRVQEGERDKLRLELALQRLRRPFAAGAFSWQRATAAQAAEGREDDAGIGGPLDPAERARGCGCGGGGGHARHGHDHGGDGGDGGDGGARDQQQQGQQEEPTEAEWRGAVDEAVRELDAAIGRINEAVEEAMMALEEEEEE